MLPCFMFPIAACGNTFVLAVRAGSDLVAVPGGAGAGSRPAAGRAERGPWRSGYRQRPVRASRHQVTFIGSTRVGTEIYNRASAAGKRCPMMAQESLRGPARRRSGRGAEPAVGAAFGARRQRCMASSVAVLVGDARTGCRLRRARQEAQGQPAPTARPTWAAGLAQRQEARRKPDPEGRGRRRQAAAGRPQRQGRRLRAGQLRRPDDL